METVLVRATNQKNNTKRSFSRHTESSTSNIALSGESISIALRPSDTPSSSEFN